ncbi:MAG TPA: hypothetical protein VEC38_05980 [Candidatus Binataceae bacterium]|nr:hypothetical protein [Candidatus Binataceae bacterium]
MALTDRQIERYSRQIIVPKVGGQAQERLLATRMILAGEYADIEAPLAYLAGAGVGAIDLRGEGEPARMQALAARMLELNPDVTVAVQAQPGVDVNLVLALVVSGRALEEAAALAAAYPRRPFVIARLDGPPRIGVFPSPPPCPRCAGMLTPAGRSRAEDAPAVAMLATVEAFKLLAGYATAPEAVIIGFEGYESKSHRIEADPRCACAVATGKSHDDR